MVLPKLSSVRSKREIGTSLSEINVTPFIDVMLVLLVIFMVTTPLMQSGIGVNLPTAETDNAQFDGAIAAVVQRPPASTRLPLWYYLRYLRIDPRAKFAPGSKETPP